jgi:F-type H+-transporting ATPase subunit epsilon
MAMAEGKLELQIVTPERLVLAEPVDEVLLPGSEGYLGVLPGHAPLLTALGVGEIEYKVSGKRHHLAVAGGFAEVLRDRVIVLAETAERADEIDLERAREQRARAEAVLRGSPAEAEFEQAQVSFRKALIRLQVHGRREP